VQHNKPTPIADAIYLYIGIQFGIQKSSTARASFSKKYGSQWILKVTMHTAMDPYVLGEGQRNQVSMQT
jgi:hypothetical protein